MSRNIRLFPTYSQKENQTTNHCLLILKMLYEENPKFLSEALSVLLGENFSGAVGVEFIQQRRSKNSVPDGEICQDPFSIFIETKLGSDFGKEQLDAHLNSLKEKQGMRTLIALGNFDQDPKNYEVLECAAKKAKDEGIAFACVSFEQFLQAIQLPYLPKNLVDAVSDLGEYFDENSLLPSWKYRLDVVSCTGSFNSVTEHKIYTCPTKGGAYNHRRSLYFGTYQKKCVKKISEIQAVVDLESESEAKLVWNNSSQPKDDLIKTARKRRQLISENWYPVKVFVLGEMYDTNFVKESSGGMFGSKQYFDIEKLKSKNAEDLANQLKGKKWEDY